MNTEIRIVVVQSGWVLVGKYSTADGFVRLSGASVIQRWGTTKGLGELALNGRTTASIIHPCGEAEIPASAVLFTLAVTEKAAKRLQC